MSYINGEEFLKQDKEVQKQLEQIDEHIKNIFKNCTCKINNEQNRKVLESDLNRYLKNILESDLITFEVEGDKTIVNLVPYYKGEKIESFKEVDIATAIKECIRTDNNIIFKDDIEIFEVGVNKSNNGTVWYRKPNGSDEELRNRIKNI